MRLAIVRAAHLIDYLSVMRDIGMPVDRDLARSRLPPSVEATPDLHVSSSMAIEWIATCGSDVEPMELGFLAARRASMASLKPAHQAMIIGAQTGFTRLKALLHIAHLEDNSFRAGFRLEADQLRVFCDTAFLGRHPFICFAEWLNLQSIVSVVRSVAGPAWCPRELCFVSRHAPTKRIYEAFPDTRICIGQPNTSILIDHDHLARSTGGASGLPDDPSRLPEAFADVDDPAGQWTFASLLRSIVQPYLNGGHPDIGFAAEVAGMSKRTLQRRLRQSGTSYSEILRGARFDLARTMLSEHGAKITDVAMTTGYESPQHFSRAFRRMTGVTPSSYRRTRASGSSLEAGGATA